MNSKTGLIKRSIIAFFLFVSVSSVNGQDNYLGVWMSISAQHDLIKNLEIEISGALRTFNKSSQIEQFFIEGGSRYKFNKYLSVAGTYRLANTIEDDSKYYFRHKFFLDIKGSFPVQKLSLSARLRLQRTTKTYIEDSEDLLPSWYSRIKVKALFNTPSFPVNPYVCIESFTPLFSVSDYLSEKTRFSAGTEIKLTDKTNLECEYIFERDKVPHISNEHIISVNYKLNF